MIGLRPVKKNFCSNNCNKYIAIKYFFISFFAITVFEGMNIAIIIAIPAIFCPAVEWC